ncbi:hypothetical protein EZS27_043004, partial [termite gut metagenome]
MSKQRLKVTGDVPTITRQLRK